MTTSIDRYPHNFKFFAAGQIDDKKIQELNDRLDCLQRAQAHTRGQIQRNDNLILEKLSAIQHEFALITRNQRENCNEVLGN
jgi:hypothetical protein